MCELIAAFIFSYILHGEKLYIIFYSLQYYTHVSLTLSLARVSTIPCCGVGFYGIGRVLLAALNLCLTGKSRNRVVTRSREPGLTKPTGGSLLWHVSTLGFLWLGSVAGLSVEHCYQFSSLTTPLISSLLLPSHATLLSSLLLVKDRG